MTARSLDQFYTHPRVALECWQTLQGLVDTQKFDITLEPSAGNGAFFSLLPGNRVGVDLDPKYPGVTQGDFFEYQAQAGARYLTVGNPPFGKNASLALRFFNYAAEFSDVVAFVLPRTFRKASMTRRMDARFHLMHETILAQNSFVFDGKAYDVPCVFQVWQKRDELRLTPPPLTTHDDFQWVEPTSADFAIQRVGGRAGKIITSGFHGLPRSSHHFIKSLVPSVLTTMQALDFDSVKWDTAGNPSVSRSEIVALYTSARDLS